MKRLGSTRPLQLALLASVLACSLSTAFAQEAQIRKNLAERIPALAKIDEVSKTPMNGLYEVRINDSDILYTDAEGNFLLERNLAFGQKHKITGTPTVFFANGNRVPGAISAAEIEKQLVSASGK